MKGRHFRSLASPAWAGWQGRGAAVLLTMLLAPVSGCTTAQWYEGARAGARQRCDALPPGAYEDCMNRADLPPYEAYRKERETGQAPSK